jgi:cell division septum initiation protein DivIVA
MDILHLIDRLEEELSRGRRLPLTSIVMLNEQRLWNVIDTMRISIPKEVEEAQRLNRERERILAQAQEQGRRIVDSTRRQAEQMTGRHELIQSARAESMEILSRAQSEAQRFQTEADSYAFDVLAQLEDQLSRVLLTVHNGMELLSRQEEVTANPDGED